MIFSNYQNTKDSKNHEGIKKLVKNIQSLAIVYGVQKNAVETQNLNNKIKELKELNSQLQIAIKQQNIKKSESQYFDQQNFNEKAKNAKNSKSKTKINYQSQITDIQQRIQSEKTRSQMISLITLPNEQKRQILKKAKQENQKFNQHILSLKKLLRNIQQVNPRESQLQLQIKMIQDQYDLKSMLVTNDSRLDFQLQIMQKQIDSIQKTQKAQNGLTVNNPKQQQILQLKFKAQQLQAYIKAQQQQKTLLLEQITKFNSCFKKQKKKNNKLLQTIKHNFYNSPQLIDRIIKIQKTKEQDLSFLLNYLGIKFQ